MRRRAAALGVGAVVVMAALLGRDTLLQSAGNFLNISDPLRSVDAVIAISGNNPERMRTASRLVLEGYAPWLIVSGSPQAAEEMVDLARAKGVPEGRIMVDAKATSTWENALGSARVMRGSGLRTAILVTSPYHMRRAVILFRRVFASHGLTVTTYSVPDSMIDLREWWTRPRDREFVLREWAKLAALLMGFR